jgi:WD40 repeat protein
LATLETGQVEGTVVTFSPDGKLLATGDWNGDIKIWNAQTREKIAELPKQELPVGGLAFSPDGSLLASGTGNYKEYQKPGTVKLWNTNNWQEVANLPGPSAKMRRVQFSPDGKTLVASGSQPQLLIYDVQSKKLAARMEVGTEAASIAFLPDSQTVAIGGYDGSMGLWSLKTRRRIARYEGHPSAANNEQRHIFSVAVSVDASVVASASADGHLKLWPSEVSEPAQKENPPSTLAETIRDWR